MLSIEIPNKIIKILFSYTDYFINFNIISVSMYQYEYFSLFIGLNTLV